MIQPDDILSKAQNLYPEFLKSWVSGKTDFFPRVVPVARTPNSEISKAAQEVQSLRSGSKQALGFGYTVEWEEVNSRRFGKNLFPKRVVFESQEDLLRFIAKQKEFQALASAVALLRQSIPELELWIGSNLRTVIAAQEEIPDLIAVVRYFQENPRPNRFVRELPVTVDTKFIERRQAILRQWLDLVLPPYAIIADEAHFERRYGLRYAEPDIFVRFLDPLVQARAGFPCATISLPLSTLISLEINHAKLIIVENRINLLTLKPVDGFIGLGGLGRAVTLLRYVPWLVRCPLIYWGDIDVDGFEILATLRRLFSQTKTLFMDEMTLQANRHLAMPGNGRVASAPGNLTDQERRAFEICASENVRIEQERLPIPTEASLLAMTSEPHECCNPD